LERAGITGITLNRRRTRHLHGNQAELPCKTSCFTSLFTAVLDEREHSFLLATGSLNAFTHYDHEIQPACP
jgi:hypothetical protein